MCSDVFGHVQGQSLLGALLGAAEQSWLPGSPPAAKEHFPRTSSPNIELVRLSPEGKLSFPVFHRAGRVGVGWGCGGPSWLKHMYAIFCISASQCGFSERKQRQAWRPTVEPVAQTHKQTLDKNPFLVFWKTVYTRAGSQTSKVYYFKVTTAITVWNQIKFCVCLRADPHFSSVTSNPPIKTLKALRTGFFWSFGPKQTHLGCCDVADEDFYFI